jgi:hypothetical protein
MIVKGRCHLPAGAHLALTRQALDANGNRIGKAKIVKTCPTTGCTVVVFRASEGGYDYQAVLVGCKHKRSAVLTAVWAGDGSGGGGGGGGTKPKWTLTKVDMGSGFSSACTTSTPTPGSPSGHAELVPGDGSHAEYTWTVPTVVDTGSTATFTTRYHTESNAEDGSGFGVGLPPEFGVTPNTFRVDAKAPPHGDAPPATANPTFTVAATPSAGNTVTIIINVCSDFYYYVYTAM